MPEPPSLPAQLSLEIDQRLDTTLGSGLIKFRVPSANQLCFTQVGGGHE